MVSNLNDVRIIIFNLSYINVNVVTFLLNCLVTVQKRKRKSKSKPMGSLFPREPGLLPPPAAVPPSLPLLAGGTRAGGRPAVLHLVPAARSSWARGSLRGRGRGVKAALVKQRGRAEQLPYPAYAVVCRPGLRCFALSSFWSGCHRVRGRPGLVGIHRHFGERRRTRSLQESHDHTGLGSHSRLSLSPAVCVKQSCSRLGSPCGTGGAAQVRMLTRKRGAAELTLARSSSNRPRWLLPLTE